jgi:hypothetical protein
MKFSKAQIQYIEKLCVDIEIDEEKIKGLSDLLAQVEVSDKVSVKSDTCVSTTKAGKRCSKKPVDDATMCSIHMKSAKKEIKTEPKKEEEIEKPIKTIKNLEEKKREIELLFGEDNE